MTHTFNARSSPHIPEQEAAQAFANAIAQGILSDDPHAVNYAGDCIYEGYNRAGAIFYHRAARTTYTHHIFNQQTGE